MKRRDRRNLVPFFVYASVSSLLDKNSRLRQMGVAQISHLLELAKRRRMLWHY